MAIELPCDSIRMPDDYAERSPFYIALVPKDFEANLAFREEMIRYGSRSRLNAYDLWVMCNRDLLFWVNTFGYIYEPRTPLILPFITYKFQDMALLALDDAIGKHDLVIEKSRDQGASWMCVTVYRWHFQFHNMYTFLMLSQKQELVDKTGDPKTLFWKFDFLSNYQPKWLFNPSWVERNQLHAKNVTRDSTVDGDSTTGTSGTADRRTSVLFDEFAKVENSMSILTSSRDVTRNRIFNSTPWGVAGGFYLVAHNSKFKKLTLHWTIHPEHAAGLYRVDDHNKVEILDHKWHDLHPGYEFITKPGFWEGYRSPWYDGECDRSNYDSEIAQELDINYEGSDSQFFPPAMLERHKREYCLEPFARINLKEVLKTPEGPEWNEFWSNMHGSEILLWANRDANNKFAQDRNYGIGIDVSAGTGASDSVICAGDCKTGEKILKFSWNKIQPHELARVAVTIANWLGGMSGPPLMIWENKGPGKNFAKTLLALGYRNVYRIQNEMSMNRKMSDLPGWNPDGNNKSVMLGEYREALHYGKYINRSVSGVDECANFVFNGDKVEHSRAARAERDDERGANHGDEVIADGLCWKAISEMGTSQKDEERVYGNCYATRQNERREKLRERERELEEAFA